MSDRERYRKFVGERIVDPRILSDAIGSADDPVNRIEFLRAPPSPRLGNSCPPSNQSDPSSNNPTLPIPSSSSSVSTPFSGSVASSPPFPLSIRPAPRSIHDVCSHPSQGAGHPDASSNVSSSQSNHHPITEERRITLSTTSPSPRPNTNSDMGHDNYEDSAPSSLQGRFISDTASYHTFGRPSVTIEVTRISPVPVRRSSESLSIFTPQFASPSTMHGLQNDNEVEFGQHEHDPSHITPSGEVDIDEERYQTEHGPPVDSQSFFNLSSSAAISVVPLDVEDDITESEGDGMLTFRDPNASLDDVRSSYLAQSGPQRAAEVGAAYHGFDMSYIRSINSRLSFVDDRSREPLPPHLSSIAPFSGSQASFAIEESFLRHLHQYDGGFNTRRLYWSFTRIKEEPPIFGVPSTKAQPQSPSWPTSNTDQIETWKCGHVGRFRVKRTAFQPAPSDPEKGVVQQVHVRQMTDRSVAHGSHSMIHKHPRAIVFSIFRTVTGGNEHSTSAAPAFVNIRAAIMLAQKSIHHKYANMKSASQHGTQGRELNTASSGAAQDDKGKSKASADASVYHLELPNWMSPSDARSTRIQRNNSGSAISSISPMPCPLPSDSHTSNTLEHDRPSDPLTPTSREVRVSSSSSAESSRAEDNSRGSANTGSTLTKRFIQVVRGSSNPNSPPPSLPSIFQSIVGPSRSPQEENDLVNDLNASFKAVGLLPSQSLKSSKSPSKRTSDCTFLGQIPDDCLCMTIPLWVTQAGSIDASSSATTPTNSRFLIVYYVPIQELDSTVTRSKMSKEEIQRNLPSPRGINPELKTVFLPAFHVVARVVDHDELLASGLKVSSGGLVVDSPEREVFTYPGSPLDTGFILTKTVVCHCYGREHGFDFLEEGLYHLGFCTREEIQMQPSRGAEGEEEEEEEEEEHYLLTPLGKVIVEMIWLGCLAVTSFGPP